MNNFNVNKFLKTAEKGTKKRRWVALIRLIVIIGGVLLLGEFLSHLYNKPLNEESNIYFAKIAVIVSVMAIILTYTQSESSKDYSDELERISFTMYVNTLISIEESSKSDEEKQRLINLLNENMLRNRK